MADESRQLQLRVLGYKTDDGLWAAHCLETDLVGYGKYFGKALDNLVELTEMQVSFAIQTQQPSLLYHPAPMHIIESYNTAFQLSLRNYAMKRKSRKDQKVASLPLPPAATEVENAFVQT